MMVDIARGYEILCLECGSGIPFGVSEDERGWLALNEGDLVTPNLTSPDSTDFLGVCAKCLKNFASPREIECVLFNTCFYRREEGELCLRPILVLVNCNNQFRSFGGRVDFQPIDLRPTESIYASGKGNICQPCLKKLGLRARLRLFFREFLHSLKNEFVQAMG